MRYPLLSFLRNFLLVRIFRFESSFVAVYYGKDICMTQDKVGDFIQLMPGLKFVGLQIQDPCPEERFDNFYTSALELLSCFGGNQCDGSTNAIL
mmetsp:Transcript_25488/g.73337  ORF Transcript_25488/g.73337 Transcript_25488/m.73337 type:complete len:94 (+) Transcript_25488:574-855(+)